MLPCAEVYVTLEEDIRLGNGIPVVFIAEKTTRWNLR